jgi:ATP synthase protein I
MKLGVPPGGAMGVFGSGGYTLVAATIGGFAAGYWVDRLLGTAPVFMILLLLAGFAGATLNIYFKAAQNRKH